MPGLIDEIKNDMATTAKRVSFWLRLAFIALTLCFIVGVVFLFLKHWIIGSIFSGVPLFCLLSFCLGFIRTQFWGFIKVRPEERIMVEFLGKAYCIKKPGLRWVCPVLMRVRRIVSIWEEPIRLFPERVFPDGVHIDFKNGGKAALVDPIVWTKLIGAGTSQEEDSIIKMIYSIDDWEIATRENVETALRTHLNNLTVDQCLETIFPRERASWWNVLQESFPNLGVTIQGYGREPTRLTISDFNWDDNVVATRQRIFEEERSIKLAELSVQAAKNEVLQRAMETGAFHGSMVDLLTQTQYGGYTKEEASKIALELTKYRIGTETKSIIDMRSSGGEGGMVVQLAGIMAALGAAMKQFQSPPQYSTAPSTSKIITP